MARVLTFLLLISLTVDVSVADFIHEMEMNKVKSDPSKFSWKSCSTVPDPLIEVKALSISPDVIVSKQDETFSGLIAVKENLSESQKLSAKLSIKMKMGGEYKDLCPLFAHLHICDIDDICSKIAGFKKSCPPILTEQGFHCSCPILKNTYKLSNVTVQIPDLSGFNGSYDVTITVFVQNKEAGCLNMRFCLNQCSPDEDE